MNPVVLLVPVGLLLNVNLGYTDPAETWTDFNVQKYWYSQI